MESLILVTWQANGFDWIKMKAIANKKSNVSKLVISVFDKVNKYEGKRENHGNLDTAGALKYVSGEKMVKNQLFLLLALLILSQTTNFRLFHTKRVCTQQF